YRGAYIAVIMKILDAIDDNKAPTIYGDGSQAYDFVYVGDCARAYVLAMKAEVVDRFYNVGTGLRTSIKELVDMIIELTQFRLAPRYEPAGLTFVKNRIGSPKRAEAELGFSSQVDLRDGLLKLMTWRAEQKRRVGAAVRSQPMCGVAGCLNLNGAPASPVILKAMTDAIRHRGPDGEGQFIDGAFALGHRRLAILDLSPTGHQPVLTPDARYILSYNGEIYNFRELRIELEARGHQFRSTGDSEVVLHAIAEWGEKALLRFNGMFALALWDREQQVLLLARDRYGIKPLYYSCSRSVFAFGSEIKALLPQPAIGTS